MNTSYQRNRLALGMLLLLHAAYCLGCGGSMKAGPPVNSMDASMAGSAEVDQLTQEIEKLKAELPNAGRPAVPGLPTTDTPAELGSGTSPDSPGDAQQQAVGQRCRQVASAICVSSERICQIVTSNPALADVVERCQDATEECERANTLCSGY